MLKFQAETTDMLVFGRNYSCSCRVSWVVLTLLVEFQIKVRLLRYICFFRFWFPRAQF